MASSPCPPPFDTEDMDLWRRLKGSDDQAARLALFDRHRPLASAIARRTYRSRTHGDLDLSDLVQQANGALLETIDRYDPSRGVPFGAYASHRIRGSLVDAIAHTSDIRAHYSARARATRDRVRSLGVPDAEALSPGDALDALAALATDLALGFLIEESGRALRFDDPIATGFSAYQSAAWHELVARLGEALDALPDRERGMMRDHYQHGVAFETLASLWGISKGRVSQIHRATLLTLRKRLAQRGHFSLQR